MTLDSSRYPYGSLIARRREGPYPLLPQLWNPTSCRGEWSIAGRGFLGEAVGFAMPTDDQSDRRGCQSDYEIVEVSA